MSEMTGLPQAIAGDKVQKMFLGYAHTEVVDSSAADVVPTHQYCRAISVDTDGVMKFTTKDHDTGEETIEVCTMKAGLLRQARNVVKVFRYYTGTTAVTTVYKTDGTLTNGLKLHW